MSNLETAKDLGQGIYTQKQTDDAIVESVPPGVITMWAGLITNIPATWFLCNGANNTPDLRGRFIFGASVDSDVNDLGGSADAIVVSHSHTANHNHSASSNTTGNHRHSTSIYKDSWYSGGGSSTSLDDDTSGGSAKAFYSSYTGNHSHTITVNTANVTTSTVGESGVGKNLPPYMKLAYIMKG